MAGAVLLSQLAFSRSKYVLINKQFPLKLETSSARQLTITDIGFNGKQVSDGYSKRLIVLLLL